MKIYQFTPNSMNKAPEKTKSGSGPTDPKAGSSLDFASVLKAASTKSAGPGGIISQENLRALQLPTTSDLGQAGRLLGRLKTDIQAASPEVLRNVHNLEGLVYVYSKGSL